MSLTTVTTLLSFYLGKLDLQLHGNRQKTVLEMSFVTTKYFQVTYYAKNWSCPIDNFVGAGMMPRSPGPQNYVYIHCKSSGTSTL